MTQWTVARQAPLPVGFPRQGPGVVAISFSGGLPNPGIEPVSLASPASAGRVFTAGAPWEAPSYKQSHGLSFVTGLFHSV